jgi:hypothetical protein
MEQLLDPLATVFKPINNLKKIPEQWNVSRTIPIYTNKGSVNYIKNYRLIANLCATSNIFEKTDTNTNIRTTRRKQRGS